jgi:hypothetical protein
MVAGELVDEQKIGTAAGLLDVERDTGIRR